ncbi:MYND finger domain-containing protein [Toxoplasma gondii TgCatPRC2]|uniref:MYND finger domain-containing protein n=9 Tax=Toxoplasma gondii TaxID=5811 RepID=S7W257_TOXGG|nr:MYND finger domain-containing protein [Toxoplasma gondii GT1]KAF4639265.1 MYND finger domain-containing protein [Toxoplasma gondii]KFG40992.1 MYND finger domain-containing protein [Toxoplasma gondii p89]KFG44474.1 MYND finger domain-containing protein [Toxoplasma gondii GAB2-2007-GAL-DOM2]KFG55866.1 MYND finger domain-containing protein [Toxoplasma gondii FOU]KFG65845.1 MYND finger domain-containing protein [Toxoplasma gondii RUB]KYK69988.1 MYND finger domain-containing protein [Toxoplasma
MSLDDVVHKKFTFVFVPADINDPVEERTFEGEEKSFRATLNAHFNRENLLKTEADKFKDDLSKQADGKLSDEQLSTLIGIQHTYQIIPLTLPTKANGFRGTNAYIDSIGRVKNLAVNARASRICSTDIRGDCFLSTTFDDEETFQRVNFSQKDFERLMASPPDATGRWSETAALSQLLNQRQADASRQALGAPASTEKKHKQCGNCGKEEPAASPENPSPMRLKRCGGCGEAFYCSAECQRADWRHHKRVCKK